MSAREVGGKSGKSAREFVLVKSGKAASGQTVYKQALTKGVTQMEYERLKRQHAQTKHHFTANDGLDTVEAIEVGQIQPLETRVRKLEKQLEASEKRHTAEKRERETKKREREMKERLDDLKKQVDETVGMKEQLDDLKKQLDETVARLTRLEHRDVFKYFYDEVRGAFGIAPVREREARVAALQKGLSTKGVAISRALAEAWCTRAHQRNIEIHVIPPPLSVIREVLDEYVKNGEPEDSMCISEEDLQKIFRIIAPEPGARPAGRGRRRPRDTTADDSQSPAKARRSRESR